MSKTNCSPSSPNDKIINELNLSELNINDYLEPSTKEESWLDMINIDLDCDFLFNDIPNVNDEPVQQEVFMNEGSILCTNEANKEDMVTTPAQMEYPNLPIDEVTIDYPDDFEDYLDSDQISTILHECSSCNGMFISDEEYESHSCQINARKEEIGPNILSTESDPKDVIINQEPDAVESNEPKKPGLNVIRKHLRKPKNVKVVKKVDKTKDKLSDRTRNDHGPHICHICDKSLSRRSSLMIHMRRHTGEMPFDCDYCQKKFVVLYDLDRHMLTHMGEKKYSCYCDVCRKPFVSKSGMIQHKRIHHGSFTIHPCDVCGQTFSRKSKLLTHKISHQSEKVMLDILNANQPNVQLLLLYDNLT